MTMQEREVALQVRMDAVKAYQVSSMTRRQYVLHYISVCVCVHVCVHGCVCVCVCVGLYPSM